MFVLSVVVILILFGLFNIIDMYLKDELEDEKGKGNGVCQCDYFYTLIRLKIIQRTFEIKTRSSEKN